MSKKKSILIITIVTVLLVGLTALAYYFYTKTYSPAEIVEVDKVQGVVSALGSDSRQLVLSAADASYKVYFYDDSYVVPVYDYAQKDAVAGGFLGQSNVNIMTHIQPGTKLMLTGFIDGDSFIVKQAYITN